MRDKGKWLLLLGSALWFAAHGLINGDMPGDQTERASAFEKPAATKQPVAAPDAEPETVVAELSPTPDANQDRRAKGAERAHALADLAVLISVDGLRPDVVFPHAISIHRLELEGAWAPSARTASKSSTLPSHASMVSGVDFQRHGLGFNAFRPERGNIQYPTIFSAAQHAQLSAALFVGKKKLSHLLDPGSQSHFQVGGIHCSKVTKIALPYLQSAEPGVVFLHFSDPDSAGHQYGWMSPQYLDGVRRSDRCVRDVIEAIRARGKLDRTLVVLTSDHGGHGHDHSAPIPPDTHIPWVAWGGAAAATTRVRRTVSTLDTAATILYALGLPMPEGIEGKPVYEALRTAKPAK